MAEQPRSDASDGRTRRVFATADIVAKMKTNPGKVFSREELAEQYGLSKSRITANLGAWIVRRPDDGIVAVINGSAWAYQPPGASTDPEPTKVVNVRPVADPPREPTAPARIKTRAPVTQKSRSRTGPTRFTWVADVASGGYLIRGNDGTLYMAKILEVD